MKQLITLLIFTSAIFAQAQEKDLADTSKTFNFNTVEHLPVYTGCDENASNDELSICMNNGLVNHISKEFKYPKKAAKVGAEGKVYVSFIIEKDGSISKVKVERKAHPALNKEAVRLIKSIPNFKKAAIQRGKPVRMQYTIPINFNLK